MYDRKNGTNTYNFLQILRVRALLLSLSFNSIFDDFTLLVNMLAFFYYFAHGTNTQNFFRVFLNTMNFSAECQTNTMNFFRVCWKHYEFFRVFGLTQSPLFIFRKKN